MKLHVALASLLAFAPAGLGAAPLLPLEASDAAALESRWPGALARVERRLAGGAAELAPARPTVAGLLRAASAYARAGALPGPERDAAQAEAVKGFLAGMNALGAVRLRFLGQDGGLGEIARDMLGDAALPVPPEEPPGPEAALRARVVLLSPGFWRHTGAGGRTRSSVLYDAPSYREAVEAAAARLEPGGGLSPNADGLPREPVGPAPRQAPGSGVSDAELPVPGDADAFPERARLELRESMLEALHAALRAAPLPLSAAAPSVEAMSLPLRRELKLLAAAEAAVEWLDASRSPRARGLLQEIARQAGPGDAAGRGALAGALSEASTLMDGSATGREDARLRAVLLGRAAGARARVEAATELAALRARDPSYFRAKASWLDYLRFNREHLAAFQPGTRFSGSELDLEPPPDSAIASVLYETARGGSLVPVRVLSTDGSSREREGPAGAWTLRDGSGKTTGWAVDSAAFTSIRDGRSRAAAIEAAARWLAGRWLEESPAGDRAGSVASLLMDAFGRGAAGAQGVQVYAGRGEEGLALEARYAGGSRRSVARFETPAGGGPPELALYDPAGGPGPDELRRTAVYRGRDERERWVARVVGNADSAARFLAGTSVEEVPVAVRYRRGAGGAWERDGAPESFPERRRALHGSPGVAGAAGEILDLAGRGATDLAASALAAGAGAALYPARAVPGAGAVAAELQRDWFERARVDLLYNAFSAYLGPRYLGEGYARGLEALGLDERKYVQNARRELDEQGYPLLGAFVGAGVEIANGALPMAVGLEAVHRAARLGPAGQLAAEGVEAFWKWKRKWDYEAAATELGRARRAYNERDPASIAAYYDAVQRLAEETTALPLFLAGPAISPASPPGDAPSRP